MPFGAVLEVALLVLVAVTGGDTEVGDGLTAGQDFDFGVFADIAEEDDFVDAFCHGNFSEGIRQKDSREAGWMSEGSESMMGSLAEPFGGTESGQHDAKGNAHGGEDEREPASVRMSAVCIDAAEDGDEQQKGKQAKEQDQRAGGEEFAGSVAGLDGFSGGFGLERVWHGAFSMEDVQAYSVQARAAASMA
uniref:Uncharacterized protein n=1 Tax=mine drainage metagenome TaxID=410659 RepID=E6PZN5_9ZZZZ